MKLTMSSEMGIHAVWFLAVVGTGEPVLSSLVARSISVSETYLIKVLKRLVAARILASRKGKKGGYRLRRAPEEITLADIVIACEGGDDMFTCLHEERECFNERACPICNTIIRATRAFYAELASTSITDLVAFGWTPELPGDAR